MQNEIFLNGDFNRTNLIETTRIKEARTPVRILDKIQLVLERCEKVHSKTRIIWSKINK
jgi:hypothetical protein